MTRWKPTSIWDSVLTSVNTASAQKYDHGMYVGGKTGTAQVSSGTPNGIFVGFAPIENPKIAVVAIVEHGDSGSAVARIVKPILEEYFNISNDANKTADNIEILEQKIEY